MFSQTNDLQKAIDQANGEGAEAASNSGAPAGDFSAIQDQLGVPPMPPTEGAGVPPMPAPFGGDAPSAPGVESAKAPETPEAPSEVSSEATDAADASRAPEAPSVPESIPVNMANANEPSAEQVLSEDGDLAQVRENVLRDLIPLMDKVQGDAEYKFSIYREAMDTLHDRALITGAYKEASKIADENKKAESLIELMKAIDTLK